MLSTSLPIGWLSYGAATGFTWPLVQVTPVGRVYVQGFFALMRPLDKGRRDGSRLFFSTRERLVEIPHLGGIFTPPTHTYF